MYSLLKPVEVSIDLLKPVVVSIESVTTLLEHYNMHSLLICYIVNIHGLSWMD